MPKKGPRNSFYFYMQDFKEEQKCRGILYNNMQELAVAAGPSWQAAPESIKKKYKVIEKEERIRVRGSAGKLTSTGVPIEEIEQMERLEEDLEKIEKKDIKSMVYKLISCNNILTEDFYIMDVHWYCLFQQTKYIMAEFGLVRVNLKDGIKDYCHELINPGKPPLGYDSDCLVTCREHGLDMPDEYLPMTDFSTMFATIKAFLLNGKESGTFPPIYAIPDNIEPIWNFICQMCILTGTDESLFRVYKLHTLLYTLVKKIQPGHKKGFREEQDALHKLMNDTKKFIPGLGCNMHEERDKSFSCALSSCRRSAYSLLEHCCPADCPQLPNAHAPVEPKHAFIDGSEYKLERVKLVDENNKLICKVKEKTHSLKESEHKNGTSLMKSTVTEPSTSSVAAPKSTPEATSSVMAASPFAPKLFGTGRGLAMLRSLQIKN